MRCQILIMFRSPLPQPNLILFIFTIFSVAQPTPSEPAILHTCLGRPALPPTLVPSSRGILLSYLTHVHFSQLIFYSINDYYPLGQAPPNWVLLLNIPRRINGYLVSQSAWGSSIYIFLDIPEHPQKFAAPGGASDIPFINYK